MDDSAALSGADNGEGGSLDNATLSPATQSAKPNGHLAADRDELARFVNCLFRYADAGTFVSLRAFDQTDTTKPPVLIRGVKVNGDLRILANQAEIAIHDIGSYSQPVVFCPPIATFNNPKQARADDLANGLTISVELDYGDIQAARARLTDLLGPPTIAMQSGGERIDEYGEIHAKVHLHWRLSEPTRQADDHARLNSARAMAALLGGADPTGAPVVHPYRWAGSWNLKAAPRMARIVEENPDAEVHLTEALTVLEDAVEAAGIEASEPHTSSEPTAEMTRLASAMAAIPNPGTEVHYDVWIKFGYAVWAATEGQGYDIWDAWSQKSDKYDATKNASAWVRIGNAKPSRIGAGTIIFYAKAAGWQEPLFQTTGGGAPSIFFDPWASLDPPEWPAGTFRRDQEEVIKAIAERDGCEFGALSMTYVTAISGAANKALRFEPYQHHGFKVPPIIYAMVVSDPGFRKSLLTNTPFAPIDRKDNEEWEAFELERARILLDNQQREDGDPRTKQKPEEIQEPAPRIVSDISVEKLQTFLAQSPRGVMYLRDEIAPLFDFKRYANGTGASERAFLLEAYDARQSRVHRMSRGTSRGHNTGIGIFGGIQIDKIAEFKNLGADGLLQRFCVFVPVRHIVSKPDVQVHGWHLLDDPIYALLGNAPWPDVYTTTPEGSQIIHETEILGAKMASATDFGKIVQGFCYKLHGLHARLAFLLHLFDQPTCPTISVDTIVRARRLAMFCHDHFKAFCSRTPTPMMEATKAIAGFVLGKVQPAGGGTERIVASTITNSVRLCKGMSLKQLSEAMAPLVSGGWCLPQEPHAGNHAWIFAPGIRDSLQHRADAERQRRAAVREAIRAAAEARRSR